VSKIDCYVNFTIKVLWVAIFPKNLCSLKIILLTNPQKGQKNKKKSEKRSKKLISHFTEKRLMRLFLGIGLGLGLEFFVTHLTHGTPLKEPSNSHRFYF
jgi:hypothetical protein